MNNAWKRVHSTAGYTIDQTILIVAVIAVLITLIIASVGWDLLNRTSGTKLAAQMRQIEEANGQFFARQGVWPHVAFATAGDGGCTAPEANVTVLAGQCLAAGSAFDSKATNIIAGLEVTANVVQHGFGNGGDILQAVGNTPVTGGSCPGGFNYLMITLTDVPVTELQEADEAIDGDSDRQAGRFFYTDPGTSSIADAVYCANLIGK